MNAICLRGRGGPEAFAYEEAPQPRPGVQATAAEGRDTAERLDQAA